MEAGHVFAGVTIVASAVGPDACPPLRITRAPCAGTYAEPM
ncbi:hypothetical protein ACWGJB_41705 [Streptomyces sp. NPDC054813]